MAFDPHFKMVTSPIFSPRLLGNLRLVIALFLFVTVVFIWIWTGVVEKRAQRYLTFFTHFSLIGMFFYFFLSGIYSRSFSKNRRKYPLQKASKSYQYLHELLFTTVVTFPILVTITFWLLLTVPNSLEPGFEAFSNVSQHILNAVFAVFEIFLTNHGPMPWKHLPGSVVLVLSYLGVAYLTRATQGFYPYPFLDPAQGVAKLWMYIGGIIGGQCALFLIVRGIIALRQRIFGTVTRTGYGSSTDWEKSRALEVAV